MYLILQPIIEMDLKEKLRELYKLSDKELELTFECFLPEKIAAKSFFVKQGKVSDRLAYVHKGLFRSFIYDEDTNDITTHFFQAGTVLISMDSFNRQIPSKENIIAVEDSEVLVITYERMAELSRQVTVWKQIAKSVDEYKFTEQMNRTIRFQTLSASERYQLLLQKNPQIIQKVALRHIASYLGIDIATLSRIRKKL